MREILFRGKFGNEWKYGFLSIEPKGTVTAHCRRLHEDTNPVKGGLING